CRWRTHTSSPAAPAAAHASPARTEAASVGKPAITYGISAARLPLAANAAAIRSTPSMPRALGLVEHCGKVLVAAPGQADQVELAVALREHPSERVRGLERRDDPLQARELAKARERLGVGHGLVARAAAVAQKRVLGPGARVVQPRGDRVRL